MGRQEVAEHIVERLAAAMPHTHLAEVDDDTLVTAVTQASRLRNNLQIVVGQLAAELHRRNPHRYTYRTIADLVLLPKTTVHRWARPFQETTR